MTRIFTTEDGARLSVTVLIEVEANRVTQVKDTANDGGYRAVPRLLRVLKKPACLQAGSGSLLLKLAAGRGHQ